MAITNATWTGELDPKTTISVAWSLAHYEAQRAGSFSGELLDLLGDSPLHDDPKGSVVWKAPDWEGLLDFDFRYNENRGVMDYVHARQCIGFLEKLEPLGEILGVDREAKAYAKFLDSERACGETNELFDAFRRGKLCFIPEFDRVLHAAKWKIEKMLGAAPAFSQIKPKLGPGASTAVKRKKACAAEKLAGPLHCSTNFIPYLPLFTATQPQIVNHHAKLVELSEDGYAEAFDILEVPGKLTFVKKDAKNFRTIVVEPSLNSFYQLGIGDAIGERLRINGLPITDQDRNIDLARYGSVSGVLATLDLSAASDSISRELVRFLLPDDWYSYLNGFRCSEVEYKGSVITLEKFSSMGNGATFPLETLIFYALTWASSPFYSRAFLSAYGDDIICASADASAVILTLERCGFSINRKKSFVDGPFRESCGADYYLGVNIRPYRLKCDKHLLSNETLFTMYNFFKRQYDTEFCDYILSLIHPSVILWGPDGYGDGHLIWDSATLRPHKRDCGWSGYIFDTYTLRARKSTRVHPGDYLHVLYTQYAQEDVDLVDRTSVGNSSGEVVKTYPIDTKSRKYRRLSVYTLTP